MVATIFAIFVFGRASHRERAQLGLVSHFILQTMTLIEKYTNEEFK